MFKDGEEGNVRKIEILNLTTMKQRMEKREEQRLEAAQMKFLRHLLGITKLDKEKKTNVLGKNGSREYSKGNKTVPGKVATTHTEDGHKQDT